MHPVNSCADSPALLQLRRQRCSHAPWGRMCPALQQACWHCQCSDPALWSGTVRSWDPWLSATGLLILGDAACSNGTNAWSAS